MLQTAPVTIMAVGLVFVLSAGEIDLSIGSIVAVSALAGGGGHERTMAWCPASLAGLAAGLRSALLNGVLVAYVRLPSFLVTLATMGLFAGVARSLTDLHSMPVTDDTFTGFFGSGIALRHSLADLVDGDRRRRSAISSSARPASARMCWRPATMPRAARVSGIKRAAHPARRADDVSGGLAGLAGLLYAGRLQAAKYTLGETDLMTVIAAVIVGGTLLNGGKGSIVGALVGSLMMGMLNNGLILMGLSVSDQMIVRGLIILAAVAVSLREKQPLKEGIPMFLDVLRRRNPALHRSRDRAAPAGQDPGQRLCARPRRGRGQCAAC